MTGRMAAPFGGPRTQDSSFSLDGEAGAAGAGDAQERAKPDRQDSGDSLASLPKLSNPVHRLAKPDLKIISKIGEGAFGEVSVANAPLYGTVAVKWLKVGCLVRTAWLVYRLGGVVCAALTDWRVE